MNYDGIQILLLRRSLNELRENHVIPLIKMLNNIAKYKDSTKEFLFGNKSRIKLGYCDTEKDVLQFQGQSYDVIILEEATQFTEFQFNCLTECNRPSGSCSFFKEPRMYFTCNPGGVGHMWVKRLFVDKDYRGAENPQDYTFIKSNVYDNEFIMNNDPNYIRILENLPEDRKRAMLYGDWDVFEGQYFREFNRDIHVIEQLPLPKNWNRYVSIDYGLDMLAVLFFAIAPNGKIYIYKEIYQKDLIISDAAKKIRETIDGDEILLIYAPPDLWNRRQDTGKSAADIFMENGVVLTKSNNDRVQGWFAVKEMLKIKNEADEQTGEIKPTSTIKICRNCTNLIRTLPQLQHNFKNPNDVANEPHELTHVNDALRGFCIERHCATIINTVKIDEFNLYSSNNNTSEEITDDYLFN